jgi:tRNA threonylcarbamoyladenosine dehydratase
MTGVPLNSRLPLDEDDVSFVFEDLHRGRSVVPPYDVPGRPVLLRWDIDAPLTLENCVVMDAKEAELHVNDGRGRWPPEVQEAVDRRRKEIELWRSWVM